MIEGMKAAGARLGIVGSALSGALMLGFVLAGSASATPADPVETAFGDMETKVLLYGGLILGLVVISAGIFLGVKYLSKAVSKA